MRTLALMVMLAVTVSAQEMHVVHGTVVDANDTPVENALVVLDRAYPAWPGSSVLQTKTDKRGKFVLEVPVAELIGNKAKMQPATIWVTRRGHGIGVASVWTQLHATDNEKQEPAKITLSSWHRFKIIVEAPNRDRLPQVRVRPYVSLGAQNAYDHMPPGIANELAVTSTRSGLALVTRIRPKNLASLLARSERFGTQWFQLEQIADKEELFSLRFREIGSIEGQIVTDDPEWLQSIRWLRIQSKTKRADRDQICFGQGIARDIKIDKDGKFRIPAIAVGSLSISASCADNVPVYPRVPLDLNLDAGQTLKLRIPLERTTQVSGQIVDADGGPVPNAVVSIYGTRREQSRMVTTDKDGRYTSSVLPGQVRVQVIVVDWKQSWRQDPGSLVPVEVPQQDGVFGFEEITISRR